MDATKPADPRTSDPEARGAEATSTVSRRAVLGGAGLAAAGAALAAGATVTAAGPALAQEQNAPGAPTAPRAADYPKPPFPVQSQPWPGLASRMEPRPDHGEQSYRGSGRLAGKRALITGGDSGIGRAAAIAYAREGASVVINHLAEEEPDASEVRDLLGAEGHTVISIPGDLRDEAFCRQLVQERRASGGASTSWSTTPRASRLDPRSRRSSPRSSTPTSRPTFTRPSGSRRRRCR